MDPEAPAVRIARAVVGGMLVAGCSFYPRLSIVNATDQAIGIRADRSATAGTQDKVVVVRAGERRSFVAGVVLDEGRVVLRIHGCDCEYPAPYGKPPSEELAMIIGAEVRLADDGTAYRVPLATRDRGGGRYEIERLGDRPVWPATRTCQGEKTDGK